MNFNNQSVNVTNIFFANNGVNDSGLILPKDNENPSELLDLTDLTGDLDPGEHMELVFTFKAVSKTDLACNQAFTSPNSRREIQSSKVCVGIDAIVPVTD